MGSLDPKLDKERGFELLRKKGAVTAHIQFSGGHDEGCIEGIMLTSADGTEETLPFWVGGGYMWDDAKQNWVPTVQPQTEDEELSEILVGPIDETFGSWGWPGDHLGPARLGRRGRHSRDGLRARRARRPLGVLLMAPPTPFSCLIPNRRYLFVFGNGLSAIQGSFGGTLEDGLLDVWDAKRSGNADPPSRFVLNPANVIYVQVIPRDE